MKFDLNKNLSSSAKILILFISLINIKTSLLNAEESYLNEIETDSSTKFETSSDLPTNPFEIMDMIRRINSINEATRPSDAIDDALILFNKIEEKDNL